MHKRSLQILFVAGLLVAVFCVPMAVRAAPPKTVPGTSAPTAAPVPSAATTAVSAVGLRLREGPYLDARVLLVLQMGETVYPAAGPVWGDNISWAYVIVYRSGVRHEGFCSTQYLKAYEGAMPPSGDDVPPITSQVKVTAYSGLRLREGPGLSYRVDRIAPRHTILYSTGVTQEADGLSWTQVVVNGEALWGATKYLQRVG